MRANDTEGERVDWHVVGDIRIEVSNRRGEYISKLPGSQQKKLYVELKLTWHGMLTALTVSLSVVDHVCAYWTFAFFIRFLFLETFGVL